MRILLAVLNDFKVFFNMKTKLGRKRTFSALASLLVVFIGYKMLAGNTTEVEETKALAAQVEILSAGELGASASFDTVGKVEAVSEANLQTETGGRITTVNVKVGDAVAAGAVLAAIENSAQRAALLQAQGSYEAALAASAQSGVGVNEASTALSNANNNAVSIYRQSYNSVNNIVYGSIDTFFSNPQGSIPGLRIDGNASFMNAERVAYQNILSEWQNRSNIINSDSDLRTELAYAKAQTERTISFVDVFISIFNQPNSVNGYTEAELQSYGANFTTLRANLINVRASIDVALSGISSAEDAMRRAELAASGGTFSASDAQVKIALGSLQAAQANYQRTVVRSPIQGVINAFYLKTGDYASPGQPAGIVANNNGLQIKTFVSEIDSANLNVGDTVALEGEASGVITAKAEALDPTNGKVAVVVGVNPDSGLTNGATVKVTFSQISTEVIDERIIIPLSALKITPDGTSVFTVSNEGTLESISVTKGQLLGENIEITSGLTKETKIVIDARGLKAGQTVTVK
jgi:multidrug efflux pump subunit AcrA (membrane-fusion protein)